MSRRRAPPPCRVAPRPRERRDHRRTCGTCATWAPSRRTPCWRWSGAASTRGSQAPKPAPAHGAPAGRAVGLIWSGRRRVCFDLARRATGLGLALLFGPMVITGVLLQVAESRRAASRRGPTGFPRWSGRGLSGPPAAAQGAPGLVDQALVPELSKARAYRRPHDGDEVQRMRPAARTGEDRFCACGARFPKPAAPPVVSAADERQARLRVLLGRPETQAEQGRQVSTAPLATENGPLIPIGFAVVVTRVHASTASASGAPGHCSSCPR